MATTTKIVLTALALLPLLFVFVHPSTSPGATTLQQKADLIRLPVMVLAAAVLTFQPPLAALLHWQYADLNAINSPKHPLFDLTCVRLC
ncbi:MAG: hypothetical protein L0Z53_00310 [Acidobacteriales bacterium]|nr:hypothetical protein [Terriglobales bacterium]